MHFPTEFHDLRRRRRVTLRRAGDCIRFAVRLALLLSLWHAPIPWIHAHDLIGPSVEHLDSLHRHVEEFHAGERSHGEAHLDLHAHLILPWGGGLDSRHSPDGSDEEDADDGYQLQWEGPAGASSKSV